MRAVIILLGLLYVAGVGYAQTALIGPDPCPAPADVQPYHAGNVDAADLNPWREVAVQPVVEAEIGKTPQGDSVLIWLRADPETGEAFKKPTGEADCAVE